MSLSGTSRRSSRAQGRPSAAPRNPHAARSASGSSAASSSAARRAPTRRSTIRNSRQGHPGEDSVAPEPLPGHADDGLSPGSAPPRRLRIALSRRTGDRARPAPTNPPRRLPPSSPRRRRIRLEDGFGPPGPRRSREAACRANSSPAVASRLLDRRDILFPSAIHARGARRAARSRGGPAVFAEDFHARTARCGRRDEAQRRSPQKIAALAQREDPMSKARVRGGRAGPPSSTRTTSPKRQRTQGPRPRRPPRESWRDRLRSRSSSDWRLTSGSPWSSGPPASAARVKDRER